MINVSPPGGCRNTETPGGVGGSLPHGPHTSRHPHTDIEFPLIISKRTLEDRKREKNRTQAETKIRTHTQTCVHMY